MARKWRPKNFQQLVGQEHVVRALTHALDEQRLHHAYLFTGTRGVGKTTIARILAKALNCEKGISSKPCGECSACREIDEGRFVDLLEVDAATNTRVEEMRTLLENAVYAPTRGRFKVYVIDEVHMLSTAAFNAMLKTLEEPPEHVKFILATTDPQKIPVTVLSRCLQFNLKQMTVADTVFQIKRILEEEKIKYDEKALPLIARAGQGSMRDALSILDQAIAYGAGEVNAEQVAQMLGAIDRDFLFNILEALINQNAQQLLEIAQNLTARAVAFSAVLQEFGLLLTRLQMLQFAPKSFEDDPEIEKLKAFANQFPGEWIQLAYQIVNIGRREMPLSPDEESGFLMTLLRLYAFRPAEYKPMVAAPAMVPPAMMAPAQLAQMPQAFQNAQNAQAPNVPSFSPAPNVGRAAAILKELEEKEENQKKSPSTVEKKTAEFLKTAESAESQESQKSQESESPKISESQESQNLAEMPKVEESAESPESKNTEIIQKEIAPTEWQNIVPALNLKGLAMVLAQHVGVESLNNNHGVLNVSPKNESLADDFLRQSLEKALSNYFKNPKFVLELKKIEPKTPTIAQQNEEKRQEALGKMQEALDSDPFIQGLKQEFSALIDLDSVRAIDSSN